MIGRAASPFVFSIAVCTFVFTESADAQDVTFVTWGGGYQEAWTEQVLEPAARDLELEIAQDSTSGFGQFRTMVKSGAVFWDVVEYTDTACAQAKAEGLLEPLDYDVIDPEGIPEEFVDSHWIGIINYTVNIGYNGNEYSQPITTWSDFWDVEKFPGRRSMRNRADPTLEFALLADGVPLEELYPLDVDRAFASLEKIKPAIAAWWSSNTQSQQLIRDGEVDLIMINNARIEDLIQSGEDHLKYHFNEAAFSYDCLLVPKGAPNKEAAMELINYVIKAEPQAKLAKAFFIGPMNLQAMELDIIPDSMKEILPLNPKNFEKTFVVNAEWWSSPEGIAAKERWSSFVQQ